VIKNDLNNFGPAVGFSWQVPFFGEGKTTVRGGYQLTYGGSGRLAGGGASNSTEVAAGGAPGALSQANTVLADFASLTAGRVLNLTDVPALVPVTPTNPAIPGGTIAIYGRTAAFSAYAPDHTIPYTQNFTLSLQRNVSSRVEIAFNYVGTVAKKLEGTLNTNNNNIYYNKELWDALELTREGGDAPLLDQMLAGLNLNVGTAGYAAVGTLNGSGVLQHGSAHLRRNATFTANLANGNFTGVAASLNTLSSGTTLSGFQPLPTVAGVQIPGISGRILRNGCDRLADGIANVGTGGTAGTNPLLSVPNRCFAENYIVANPQLGTTTYIDNTGYSNYNSIQSQITLRPKQGISYQATYSFTKQLALAGSVYSDPLNMRGDFTDGGTHKQDFRSNGSFELPFGPNKLLLGNSTGFLARAVERWQMNVIYNVTSGTLASVGGQTGMYANFVPDVVGPFGIKGGNVQWNGPLGNGAGGAGTGTPVTGTYFGQANFFTKVKDPQCNVNNPVDSMGFNWWGINGANCTLNALALTSDPTQIVLQNPTPGTKGNMGRNHIWGPGTWSLDGNLGKTFRISDSKSLQVRVDATNVLNHPTPGNLVNNAFTTTQNMGLATVNGAGNDFGSFTTKSGTGAFQGQLRFNF